MTDELNPNSANQPLEPAISGANPAPPQPITLQPDEHAALVSSKEEHDKLMSEAQQYGFKNPREYVDYLVDVATGMQPPKEPAKPAQPVVAASPKLTPPPQPNPDIVAATQKADYATQVAERARTDSQWVDFMQQQNQLPEGERSKLTRPDLEKFMYTPRGYNFVGNLVQAGQYGGNIYAAANDLLGMERIKSEARAEGLRTGQALAGAANTASLGRGGLPPAEKKKEKPSDEQLADRIAPKAGVFEG